MTARPITQADQLLISACVAVVLPVWVDPERRSMWLGVISDVLPQVDRDNVETSVIRCQAEDMVDAQQRQDFEAARVARERLKWGLTLYFERRAGALDGMRRGG